MPGFCKIFFLKINKALNNNFSRPPKTWIKKILAWPGFKKKIFFVNKLQDVDLLKNILSKDARFFFQRIISRGFF